MIAYEDVSMDIERLVSMKVGRYHIPGYDRDDMAQEIRLTCVKALSKYDKSKNNSTPFHFLARCVDNRLRNMVRDHTHNVAKSQRTDKKALERSDRKKLLSSALSMGDEVSEEAIEGNDFLLGDFLYRDSIRQKLPDDVKPSFTLLLSNGPPSICRNHLRIIKKVIQEYGC